MAVDFLLGDLSELLCLWIGLVLALGYDYINSFRIGNFLSP